VGLQSFERRIERMVEGVFARASRGKVRPIELGRRLVREMDDNRTVDVRGRTVVPNHFMFHLSEADHQPLSEIADPLITELVDAAREHAHDEGYGFLGPVTIELGADPELRAGRFELTSRLQAGTGGGVIVLPSGTRVPLGDRTVTIGRLPECDINLADPNVSRRHAELRPAGAGFVLTDLRSTNGTRVNGTPVSEQALRDGDVITVGATALRYEGS
jgi:hypothetical protein